LFIKEKNEVWPWLIDLYQAIVLFHEGRHYEARRLAAGRPSEGSGRAIMNVGSILTLGTMALLWSGASSYARADETLKFRAIAHATSVQSQDVGDVDGHLISVGRFSGIASFPDGAVGTTYFVFVTDYIKSSGTFSTHNNLTLNDGSVLWYKLNGTTKVEQTISRSQGTVTVVGGTGKYEGAKGDGTITGVRVPGLATGVDRYDDFVINVKK